MDIAPEEKKPASELKLENLEEAKPPPLSAKDEAFIKSSDGARSLSFGGRDGGPVELVGYDTIREVAAQKMGMEFFNMGEEVFAEFRERGTYNGIYMDAIIVTYLCVSPDAVARKAMDCPHAVRGHAMQWIEKNGVRIGNTKHAELIEAFGEILNDIFSSVAEVDETGMKGGGESLGESSETSPNTSDLFPLPPTEA